MCSLFAVFPHWNIPGGGQDSEAEETEPTKAARHCSDVTWHYAGLGYDSDVENASGREAGERPLATDRSCRQDETTDGEWVGPETP